MVKLIRGNVPVCFARTGILSTHASLQALRRDPDSSTCARGLKRLRGMTNAKEAGNAAFKTRQWVGALQHYSAALEGFDPAKGNETFFAQCFGNR